MVSRAHWIPLTPLRLTEIDKAVRAPSQPPPTQKPQWRSVLSSLIGDFGWKKRSKKTFTRNESGLSLVPEIMRIASTLLLVGVTALLATGCAGPEKKLGRGLLNVTEFARLGELRRSMEQTYIWDGTDQTYTTGFFRGLNRSVARTALGAFEVATFPLPTPTYNAMFTSKSRVYPDATVRNKSYPWGGMTFSEHPTYPDSFKPGLIEDSTFHTDTALGFSGGDVAPFIPGSRFKIFDN